MELLANKFVLIVATFGFFAFGKYLQRKTGLLFLNPILIATILLIVLLKSFSISYDKYYEAGNYIDFWLKPSVVALGVPLYRQLKVIKTQWISILLSQMAACIVGILSVVFIAKLLGASPEVIRSLAPKSVTTPIAMEVSKAIGGIPPLTAAVVIVVGLFGAIFGVKILQVGRVTNPMAFGLSMGAASHAVGTSKAMEISEEHGVYASLGLIMNGILTALLAPLILSVLKIA